MQLTSSLLKIFRIENDKLQVINIWCKNNISLSSQNYYPEDVVYTHTDIH